MKSMINKLSFLAMLVAASILSSCGDDDDTVAAPIASFTFTVEDLTVTFTNGSKDGETYSWDFGDGSAASTEANPTHTYAASGTYTVKLTATNAGGSDDSEKQVKVQSAAAENQIKNGGFDDDSEWTIISHNASGNGVLTIADGVATWDEATDVASGSWGSEAHMGMYQAVTVEAGSYQFDLDITIGEFDEVWFEVWVGADAPAEGSDYSAPATRVLSANAWDCKDTQANFSGSLAGNSCNGTDGSITLAAGTYYVVIRSGGFTFGEGGIVVDNVSMVSAQ